MSTVVVLGMGNLLMGDDGVGVRCVQALARDERLPLDVGLIDGGTSTHELLEDLEHLDVLLIVDAVAAAEAPGTIVRFEGERIPSAFSNKMSPHQHGINDLLATLTLLGRAPKRVILLGVVPARIELGMDLSPLVAGALPALCDRVVAEVAALADQAARSDRSSDP